MFSRIRSGAIRNPLLKYQRIRESPYPSMGDFRIVDFNRDKISSISARMIDLRQIESKSFPDSGI